MVSLGLVNATRGTKKLFQYLTFYSIIIHLVIFWFSYNLIMKLIEFFDRKFLIKIRKYILSKKRKN